MFELCKTAHVLLKRQEICEKQITACLVQFLFSVLNLNLTKEKKDMLW